MHASARFIPLPENRFALQAVTSLAEAAESPLLILHGAPGSGKSHLVNGLVDRFTQADTSRTAQVHAAGELGRGLMMLQLERRPLIKEAIACDLLVVEDLQHLQEAAGDELAYILDRRQVRRKPGLITAVRGPAELTFSARLRSRLGGGLVVGIAPLSASSRKILVVEWCRERKLKVTDEVIDWLARDPGGARPILGNITLLEVLAKRFPPPLTMQVIRAQIPDAIAEDTSPLDSLIVAISARFHVTEKMLLGPSRSRNIVWPRQVAMYVARQAGFTFVEIGSYFGGRDHSTVMHSCDKVQKVLATDVTLAKEIEELQSRTSISPLPS